MMRTLEQEAKIERLTAENERLRAALMTISSLDRVASKKPQRTWDYGPYGDIAASALHPVQQQPPSCDKAPNKHHYLMPSGQCSCQDQSWAK